MIALKPGEVTLAMLEDICRTSTPVQLKREACPAVEAAARMVAEAAARSWKMPPTGARGQHRGAAIGPFAR